MMVNFYESFGNDADVDKEIPQEILEDLCKKLPKNLMYLQNENGQYQVVPRPNREAASIKMTTQFDFDIKDDAQLIEKLKIIRRDKWVEYFYRTQKSIAVKNVKIGNDEQLIPLEQTVGHPLAD